MTSYEQLTKLIRELIPASAERALDPPTLQVFLVGYLIDKKVLPCELKTFDDATDAFIHKTGLPCDQWIDMLLQFCVQTSLKTKDYDFEAYIRKNIVEAFPEDTKPTDIIVPIFISGTDYAEYHQFLQSVASIPGLAAGYEFARLHHSEIEITDLCLRVRIVLASKRPVMLYEVIDKDNNVLSSNIKRSLTETAELVVNPNLTVKVVPMCVDSTKPIAETSLPVGI